MDSSGIRALLLCQRELNGGTGTMRLVGVTPHVERVFKIAGIEAVLEIGTVEATALSERD